MVNARLGVRHVFQWKKSFVDDVHRASMYGMLFIAACYALILSLILVYKWVHVIFYLLQTATTATAICYALHG